MISKINKVIKHLLLSDILFYFGWGLVAPLLSVFILERIAGANALVVGISTAIYSLTFSLLRVPFGIFLDNKQGEKDDYWFMTFGLLGAALVNFVFIVCTLPWHLYLLQFFHGLFMAMSVSGWSAIFYRHVDKNKQSTEYGLSSSSISLATAISAVAGGWSIENFGFTPTFVIVGIFGLFGVGALLLVESEFPGQWHVSQYFSKLADGQVWKKFFEKSYAIRIKEDDEYK